MRKNYVVLVIRPDGKIDKIVQASDPRLAQLQELVGGYIQLVPGFTRFGDYKRGTAYCDEDGKLHERSYNYAATQGWQRCFGFPIGDVLVGDVVFVARTDEPVDR